LHLPVFNELLPNGNNIIVNTKQFGESIKRRRKTLAMNQADLALVSGTGVRFISDLENGKPTCELGKALKVLENLGIEPVLKPRDER